MRRKESRVHTTARSAIGALSDRQEPNTVPAFLDDDYGAARESLGARRQDSPEALDDMLGTSVVKTKHDNARPLNAGKRGDLAKVEIHGKNDALFRDCLGEDVTIRQSLKPFIAEVSGMMTLFAQP
jgi:hypothetical protein